MGEKPRELPAFLENAMSVNPSLDLAACIDWIERPATRMYDRHFVRRLYQQVERSEQMLLGGTLASFTRKPRNIREFDELYTAPVSGFGTAKNYYALCSAAQFVPGIQIPTLILSSRDDPLIPARLFDELEVPPAVTLHMSQQGGHLGYVARSGIDPDRRWMEWRVLDWVKQVSSHNGTSGANRRAFSQPQNSSASVS